MSVGDQPSPFVGVCAHPAGEIPPVGERYDPARTAWPTGAAYWVGAQDRHRLLIALPDVSVDERESITSSAALIGVATSGPVLFMLWKFWRFDWADCPYSVHLQSPIPELSDSLGRLVLEVVLIEATTGAIQARRSLQLAAEVSQALRAALRAQIGSSWDEIAFNAAVRRVYDQIEPGQLADQSVISEIEPLP